MCLFSEWGWQNCHFGRLGARPHGCPVPLVAGCDVGDPSQQIVAVRAFAVGASITFERHQSDVQRRLPRDVCETSAVITRADRPHRSPVEIARFESRAKRRSSSRSWASGRSSIQMTQKQRLRQLTDTGSLFDDPGRPQPGAAETAFPKPIRNARIFANSVANAASRDKMNMLPEADQWTAFDSTHGGPRS